MLNQITSEEEYLQVMEKIENYLQQATNSGGFHTLTPEECDALQHLSMLAEAWEDNILLMPNLQSNT